MFIRCAYFVGKPIPGKEAQLRARLAETLGLYMGFDKIRRVQLLSTQAAEEGAPDVFACLQLSFDTEQDLQQALATPYRQQLRAHFAEAVLPLFDGTVKHINHQVSDQVPTH